MSRGVLGVSRKVFSEYEISIIRQHFDPTKSEESCKMIHRNYLQNRTPKSILGKASRMGLQRHTLTRKWEEEELDIIRKYGKKYPLFKIYAMLKKVWNDHEWRYRGYPSVRRKLEAFGYSSEGNDSSYYNQEQLAQALGCQSGKILSWMLDEEFKKVLKPEKPCGNKGMTLIHVRNFRRFMELYPGEIAKCRPDILWLLSIALEKDNW